MPSTEGECVLYDTGLAHLTLLRQEPEAVRARPVPSTCTFTRHATVSRALWPEETGSITDT